MKIDLTDISPVRKRMSVEVAVEEVRRETESILKGYRRKARIPGFRQGKAPLSVVRAHFAEELKEDLRDRIVSASFHEAAREKGLEPLGNPALEDISYEDGKPLVFKTVFEVLPDIRLKDYKEVVVTRPVAKVTDDEVGAAMEEIRRSRVQLVTKEDREAVAGDVVYVDVEGASAEREPIRRERMPIEVGAEQNIDEFNKKLLGAHAGAVLEFPVSYPDSYGAKDLAGKRVDYRLTVREVKQPILPDLDDEFAKDLGDFDDLASLEAKVRTDLDERKRHEAERATREAVLNRVLADNPVVLPDVLVEQEIRRRLEDFVRNLIMQGVEPDKAKIDWEQLRKQQDEPARKSVHARLILDEVAKAENIDVDENEIEARIREDAERLGESPEKLRVQMQKHEGKEALRTQLVREKSLDYLTSVANIQYAD
jgi:trigger factor